MVKALDLRSNGCVVRVGSNPTPGNFVNNFNRIKQHEKRTNKFCFVSYCFCCSMFCLVFVFLFVCLFSVVFHLFYFIFIFV